MPASTDTDYDVFSYNESKGHFVSPLYEAVSAGNEKLARKLVNRHHVNTEIVAVSVDQVTPVSTLLHAAVAFFCAHTVYNREDYIKAGLSMFKFIIFELGGDPNQLDANGESPIMLALHNGDLVDYLIEAGCNASLQHSITGENALHYQARIIILDPEEDGGNADEYSEKINYQNQIIWSFICHDATMYSTVNRDEMNPIELAASLDNVNILSTKYFRIQYSFHLED